MKACIYARYSSANQREASIEDQSRNCRRRIESEGWQLGEVFRDEAMSGSLTERPGYQKLLRAAAAREFAILVVDDLSRLSRDQVESERTIRRLEFGGIRIIGVSDGYDSSSKGRKVQRGVRGLLNEVYLDDLRDKTHRGLAGQAIKQYWAGGRPFGYRLIQLKDDTRQDGYGNAAVIGTKLEVDETQAKVVREIFDLYANDYSPRSIAARLNAKGIASPGSSWRGRTVRRASGWLGSTIHSLMQNELYCGRYIWNKSAWIKNPDTGRRTARPRPQSEWISHDMPALRIVSDALWQRVKARRRVSDTRGAPIRTAKASGQGGPKYAFSGLLRCECCGSSLVIAGGTGKYRAYGCSGNKFGGDAVCHNAISVRQEIVETRLLEPIKTQLLAPEIIADIQRRVVQRMGTQGTKQDTDAQIATLRQQIENMLDAISGGALRHSPALGARLADYERQLEQAKTQAQTAGRQRPVDFPARLADRIRGLVEDLEHHINADPNRARAALREMFGPTIPVRPDDSGTYLVARLGLSDKLLAAAAGSEMLLVAGGGFDLCITHALALPIVPASLR